MGTVEQMVAQWRRLPDAEKTQIRREAAWRDVATSDPSDDELWSEDA